MTFNKLLAILLVVLFVIFTLAAILTWLVGDRILDDEAYVQALEAADFFEVPYQLIREGQVPEAGGLLLTEGPLSVVSGEDLEIIARELAPPDWLRAQVERAIRDVLAVAEAPEVETLPHLAISLQEVKARALGEPGDRALSVVVEALPECEPGQAPLDVGRDQPICTPAGVDVRPFVSQLKVLLRPLVTRVPDTYQVTWPAGAQDVLEDLQRAGQILERLRVILVLLIALNGALLALIWLLVARSPAEWLRWTGGPLLLLGGAVFLAGWLIPRFVDWRLDQAQAWPQNVSPVLIQSLEAAVNHFTALLLEPVTLAGVILFAVGLSLMLLSLPFGTRSERTAF
jgi:hypothetical protein